MTSDEATKWIGEWIGLSASMIRSGEDFTPTAEEVHKKARASLATLLSALSASQAEVERLTRERDEWKGRAADREHEAEQRARKQWAAEARATRAEAERDALHLAICGGEDAPGYAASLSHETALKVLADNYASAKRDSELAWDGETANTWKARATRAEGLLEETYAALTDHNDLLRSAFQAAQRDATHDVRGTTNYRLLADRAHDVLTKHHGTTNAARAFLDKLKSADAPSGVTATDAELGPGRNT